MASCNTVLRAAVVTAVLLSLVPSPGQASAAALSRTAAPRLEITESAGSDATIMAFLESDRRWLAALPPVLRMAVLDGVGPRPEQEGSDTQQDGAAFDPDGQVLAWLQQAERLLPRRVSDPTDGAEADVEPLRGHRDVASLLRDRWLARGYLATRVAIDALSGTDPAESAHGILITPGVRYRVRVIAVESDTLPGGQAMLDAWLPRPGDVFIPESYLEAAAAVVLECAERGYPFPIWLTRSLQMDPDRGEVTVNAVLMLGRKMAVGPQSASLPDGRGEAFVIKAAGLRRGQVFRESALRRGRERLVARNLFTRVDEPQVHLTAALDTVGIVWQVEPQRRANRFSVVLGLSRRDDAGARLSGQVDLDLPNMAGTGRRLTAGWRDDGRLRSRFGFRYLEPLILGTPLDMDIALENEVAREVYTLFQLQNRWRLTVVGFWGLELGVAWDRTTYPEGDVMGARRLRWRAGVLRQRGDMTRTGWSGSFAVETAQRSTQRRFSVESESSSAALPGQGLGRQDRQRLVDIDLDAELWLRADFSLAGRVSFRQNDADELPVALPELYRLGGAATLRGYGEDSFAGEKVAWGGLEARLGRALRSRVYAFADMGYVERTVRAAAAAGGGLSTSSGIHVGYGLGLLTTAAAGQINIAVGFPGSVDIERAMLHVSLLGGF